MASLLTPKQRKTFAKITEVLNDHPFGAIVQDLYNEARLSMTVIKNALEKMDNVEQRGDSWFLKTATPATNDAREVVEPTAEQPVMQDKVENMQDVELNTQATPISYPDNDQATLINPNVDAVNPSADDIVLINPNTGRQYVEIRGTGKNIQQAIESVANRLSQDEEQFELQPPPVHQKRFLLIENCYLSLAQDGAGQEPSIAKDVWFDDQGEEVEESDCNILNRARESHTNKIEFKGVTYRNLFVAESQLFHGVFDSPATAHERMAELMAKKPSNIFEVIEV